MALTFTEQVAAIADVALTARVRQGMLKVALEVMAATPKESEPETVRRERHLRRTRYAVEVLRAPDNAAGNMLKALVTLDAATANPADAAIVGGVKLLWDAFSEVVLE
jgi:hypothetical protein